MQIPVLDKGFVRLDAFMADDLSVVNSARVSFDKKSSYEVAPFWEEGLQGILKAEDEGLINFLMKNRHGTPFEHNAIRWHIKCPMFVAREWFRHRIGSFNEWSARYSQLEAEFYIPAIEDVRSQVGTPGSYSFEPLNTEEAQEYIFDLERESFRGYEYYLKAMRNGVAKELARAHLPVGIYTQFYWTLNARSLMNFLSLRNAPSAQLEIRRYAEVIESEWANLMPVTAEAFVQNNRIAP